MMTTLASIGTPPWSDAAMRAALPEFAEIYARRPIRDNEGGMASPHLFLAWFVLRWLAPETVIESGVLHGQGSWAVSQACPNADLHCLDPTIRGVRWRSPRASYYDRDFSTFDWRGIDRERTVLLFDDHQNAYERLRLARWHGFRHLLFEDNYPAKLGDCYSLKKAFAHAGFTPESAVSGLDAMRAQMGLPPPAPPGTVPPNDAHDHMMRRHIEVYQELPPVFVTRDTRFGDAWCPPDYPTPEPLLREVTEPYQQVYLDEARSYTWMAYVRLRP